MQQIRIVSLVAFSYAFDKRKMLCTVSVPYNTDFVSLFHYASLSYVLRYKTCFILGVLRKSTRELPGFHEDETNSEVFGSEFKI
mmetsp:Transcript_13918/g.20353  ORF Transcript_13918/g.20353 Transcript_13918/m.20353 type:complete len:84 (+) Transcript_13918:1495-1746(+)